MKNECKDFRAALEAELLGRASQERLAWLSWHEHLLSCAVCRELMEKEEALEALLATLPEPRLPAALARRVLLRLEKDRMEETRLDRLLDLDRRYAHVGSEGERAPENLAAQILGRLAPERRAQGDKTAEERLDALLDLDARPRVPAGLASRVLRGLAGERHAPAYSSSARVQRNRRRPRSWMLAAAAGLLVMLLGRILWVRTRTERPVGKAPLAQSESAPDPQLLASLDVVEQWDLLMHDDLDVLLSTLGPADEALLDYR